jgi:hypothetical protein
MGWRKTRKGEVNMFSFLFGIKLKPATKAAG